MKLRILFSVFVVATATAAAPTVSIVPPNGARFFPGQRFDIRVEAKGTGKFAASLTIGVGGPGT